MLQLCNIMWECVDEVDWGVICTCVVHVRAPVVCCVVCVLVWCVLYICGYIQLNSECVVKECVALMRAI